jgi:tRNA(Leu) C34 or U34 (ribose-2'-O)-methylase TrmL
VLFDFHRHSWSFDHASKAERAFLNYMFQIVLIEPEIPHNAGAAGRLALATDSTLHLVKPLGFSLEDKHVRRTGLDYWQDVKLHVWESFAVLREQADPVAKFWFLSTKATRSPWQAKFPIRRLSCFRQGNKGATYRAHRRSGGVCAQDSDGSRRYTQSESINCGGDCAL